jgi:hypothetical protein
MASSSTLQFESGVIDYILTWIHLFLLCLFLNSSGGPMGVTLCQTVGGCHGGTAVSWWNSGWLLMYCNPHLKFSGLQRPNLLGIYAHGLAVKRSCKSLSLQYIWIYGILTVTLCVIKYCAPVAFSGNNIDSMIHRIRTVTSSLMCGLVSAVSDGEHVWARHGVWVQSSFFHRKILRTTNYCLKLIIWQLRCQNFSCVMIMFKATSGAHETETSWFVVVCSIWFVSHSPCVA